MLRASTHVSVMTQLDELPSRQTAAIVVDLDGERSIQLGAEVLGIDLGKTVCSLAGLDATGAVLYRKCLQLYRPSENILMLQRRT